MNTAVNTQDNLWRPARALLHPAWWAALLLMAVNDHWFKANPTLPELLTGKLSDITGLVVAPAVLAVVLRARSRRGVLGAHVAVGLWFAAMNLWPAFAQAWAKLTAFSPFPPWHPVVDAGDLLTLPALWLGWRLLTPAMAATPPVAVGLRLDFRRFGQVVALAAASVFLLGNEPVEPRNGFAFQMPGVQIAIGNATADQRLLRIRALRNQVQIDCDAVAGGPDKFLSRKLFAPAEIFTVQANEVLSFQSQFDQQRPCSAYLVDGPGIPMRLLFWKAADFPPVTQSSQLQAGRQRVAVVTAAASGALGWSPHTALFNPPAPIDDNTATSCQFPSVDEALAWSAPVPLAASVSLTAVSESADGCLGLDLQMFDGPYRWFLCVPVAAFPFDVGTKLTITKADTDYAFGKMDGLSLTNTKTTMIVGRGTSVPYFGKGDAKLVASPNCGGRFDSCGGFASRLDVHLVGIEGSEPVTLVVGQAALVGKGKTLHLVRALNRMTVDGACQEELQNADGSGSPKLGPMVESVLVEEP